MALTVLGMGVSASSPMVPEERREALKQSLEFMDADMKASPYDWELFYVEADIDFDIVLKKLREKEWDCVLLGGGLRAGPGLTIFFEKLVNAVHKELPNAKFAFNTTIEATQEACRRVLEG